MWKKYELLQKIKPWALQRFARYSVKYYHNKMTLADFLKVRFTHSLILIVSMRTLKYILQSINLIPSEIFDILFALNLT